MNSIQEKKIADYIEKIETYKCSICDLEGSEIQIRHHLTDIKNADKFPFVDSNHLPIGSLIKVKNNYKESYSLTNIINIFYTIRHELCYTIWPRISTRDYDHYTYEYGEYGGYIYDHEVLNCKRIKENNLILEQNSLDD